MRARGWFSKDSSRREGIAYRCRECLRPGRASRSARRRKRALLGPGYTGLDVIRKLREQRGCCALCRKPVWITFHVDHIVPLSKGGLNSAENIQVTCPRCNLRKGARYDVVAAGRVVPPAVIRPPRAADADSPDACPVYPAFAAGR